MLLYHDLCFLLPAVITQIFNPIAEFVIAIEIATKEAKLKQVNGQHSIKNPTNFFILLTHQLTLVYFFNEIISDFIYVFQSNFLT